MIDRMILDFFNDLDECPEEFGECSTEQYFNEKKYPNVELCQGASKAVYIFDDLDYVIKVPFHGCENENYISEECWDEEIEGCAYDPDESYAQLWWSFENGGSRENDYDACNYWDYCALEEEISKSAIEEGFEHIILPTTFLCEVNGYRLYKQPKATYFKTRGWKEFTEEEESKAKTIRSTNKGADRLPKDFILKMWDIFSQDFCERLFAWIEEERISDLHTGNIAIRHGHPVIIDYCGFSD